MSAVEISAQDVEKFAPSKARHATGRVRAAARPGGTKLALM
jgi:hypothetical protein